MYREENEEGVTILKKEREGGNERKESPTIRINRSGR